MSKNELLDGIFATLANKEIHRNANFIKDGILAEEKWDVAKKKVLFLFKEAYTEDGEDHYDDLRKLITEKWQGPRYAMWQRVAEIAYLIQNTTPSSFPTYQKADESKKKDALLSSAVINIKKSNGQRSSKDDDLSRYAASDREELINQIDIISPSIVVMGGTKDLVDKHVINLGNPLYEEGNIRIYKVNERVFIEYYHPAWFGVPALMYYYTLAAVYSNFLRDAI